MSTILQTIMPSHISGHIIKRLLDEGFVRNKEHFEFVYRDEKNELFMAVFSYQPRILSVFLNNMRKEFPFIKEDYSSFAISYNEAIDFIVENMNN